MTRDRDTDEFPSPRDDAREEEAREEEESSGELQDTEYPDDLWDAGAEEEEREPSRPSIFNS